MSDLPFKNLRAPASNAPHPPQQKPTPLFTIDDAKVNGDACNISPGHDAEKTFGPASNTPEHESGGRPPMKLKK